MASFFYYKCFTLVSFLYYSFKHLGILEYNGGEKYLLQNAQTFFLS